MNNRFKVMLLLCIFVMCVVVMLVSSTDLVSVDLKDKLQIFASLTGANSLLKAGLLAME